jgi:predicted RNase H-like HicB family nuclease
MTVLLEIQPQGGDSKMMDGVWTRYSKRPIECLVHLCPEATGGFSAYLPTLPGVVSEGETQEETLRNIQEAFRGVIGGYRAAGTPVPWTAEIEPRPRDAKELRIVVNA